MELVLNNKPGDVPLSENASNSQSKTELTENYATYLAQLLLIALSAFERGYNI